MSILVVTQWSFIWLTWRSAALGIEKSDLRLLIGQQRGERAFVELWKLLSVMICRGSSWARAAQGHAALMLLTRHCWRPCWWCASPHTRAHAGTHRHVCVHAHTDTQVCTYTCAHTHTYTCMHSTLLDQQTLSNVNFSYFRLLLVTLHGHSYSAVVSRLLLLCICSLLFL